MTGALPDSGSTSWYTLGDPLQHGDNLWCGSNLYTQATVALTGGVVNHTVESGNSKPGVCA